MTDEHLEEAFTAGAVSALRRRAAVQRDKASTGVSTVGDTQIVSSEARQALNIAGDLEAIAGELLGGAK
jgi:hypothetical protein